jgi:hypothetical protein
MKSFFPFITVLSESQSQRQKKRNFFFWTSFCGTVQTRDKNTKNSINCLLQWKIAQFVVLIFFRNEFEADNENQGLKFR